MKPVANGRIGVIADIVDVDGWIGGRHRRHHQEVGRLLVDRDSDLADLVGQARLGEGDAVLHQHLRRIDVGARLERDRDGRQSLA